MNRVMRRVGLVGCAALLAGCISPQSTRLPSLSYNRDVRSERQSYNYLYPLADPSGQGYQTAQRGFEYPRAEPRRALEKDETTRAILGTSGVNTGLSPAVSRYPASVTP
jgi:hypothetical protein